MGSEMCIRDSIIAEARSMTCNAEAVKALDEIEKLCQLIAEYGFEKYITIDLGMLTEYDYYTGMIFRGYTYGTGDAVVKGGRYDHLIGQFGKDAASVGFAVVLDELMLALSRQKIDIPTNEEATMVLYEPEYRSTAIRTANQFIQFCPTFSNSLFLCQFLRNLFHSQFILCLL